MKLLTMLFVAAALSGETKLKLADLPEAVRNTVKEQTKTATLKGLSKETEKGKTVYEVETTAGGKSRDLMVNRAGEILSVEEQVDLDSIPAAARTAFEKQAAGGSVIKVEKVTVGSAVSYEAAMKLKSGKKTEVAVNGDGSPHR